MDRMTATAAPPPAALDAHGNPLGGPPELVARYDAAVDHLLRYHTDLLDDFGALATETTFPMGQILAGYLSLTSTDTEDLPGAVAAARALDGLVLNEREALHRTALLSWLEGDWRAAARSLDQLLVRWPADLVALLVGHQLDFFLGDAANLRDRVARSASALPADHPHQGFVLGMLAFGLEETGSYEHAEDVGLAALERNPDDVWAVHAVVHTYEMRGRADDGLRFLRTRESDWAADNLFTVHNWWHLALFLLEAGTPDQALAVYDDHLHNDASAGVPLEMLDASALLWRLRLEGPDVDEGCGPRFAVLADAWAGRMDAVPWYVFNDAHAVMAFVGAGRLDDARAVTNRLARFGTARRGGPSGPGTNRWMTNEVGLTTCRALLAFGEGRHADVVDLLLPIRATTNRFGGSHAQRDALQRTLLESALRCGRNDLARALLAERLTLRARSVHGWSQRARLARAEGDDVAARDAEAEAARLRTAFATTR